MKAAIYTRYGPPSVVQIVDVEKPIPKGNEVLIKVRVASVNPLDWHFMRGMPYFLRIATGLRKPKDKRLGADVAGQVEAAAKNVTQFQSGRRSVRRVSGCLRRVCVRFRIKVGPEAG